MTDSLFIGTEGGMEIDTVLRDACVRLNQMGIQTMEDDLIAMHVEADHEPRRAQGYLKNHDYLRVSFKNVPFYIFITQFENEIVPGYSWSEKPSIVGVSVWVGADAIHRALAGTMAIAIATIAGGKILDANHKWSNIDLSCPEEFMDKVARKYIGS